MLRQRPPLLALRTRGGSDIPLPCSEERPDVNGPVEEWPDVNCVAIGFIIKLPLEIVPLLKLQAYSWLWADSHVFATTELVCA